MRLPGALQVLHPIDEARPEAVGLTHSMDVGQLGEEFGVQHIDLSAGQVSTKTKVRPGAPEADVVRVVAGDVEPVGVVENGVVAIAGPIKKHDLVALVEDRVAEANTVLGDSSSEVNHRARVPHDLLDGTRHVGCEVSLQERLLLRIRGEIGEAPADRVAGRFVARSAEQDEEALDLFACQLVAVDLGVDEGVGERVAVASVGLASDLIDEPGERSPGAEKRFERVLIFGNEFGVTLAQDDVRHVEDEFVLTLGNAHHVADDLDGQPRGACRDEVATRPCFLPCPKRQDP